MPAATSCTTKLESLVEERGAREIVIRTGRGLARCLPLVLAQVCTGLPLFRALASILARLLARVYSLLARLAHASSFHLASAIALPRGCLAAFKRQANGRQEKEANEQEGERDDYWRASWTQTMQWLTLSVTETQCRLSTGYYY